MTTQTSETVTEWEMSVSHGPSLSECLYFVKAPSTLPLEKSLVCVQNDMHSLTWAFQESFSCILWIWKESEAHMCLDHLEKDN